MYCTRVVVHMSKYLFKPKNLMFSVNYSFRVYVTDRFSSYNIPYAPGALIASLYCLAGLLVSDNSAGKPFLSSFSSSTHCTHFRYLTSPACPPTKSVGEFSNNFPAAVLICQFIDACGRTTVLVS